MDHSANGQFLACIISSCRSLIMPSMFKIKSHGPLLPTCPFYRLQTPVRKGGLLRGGREVVAPLVEFLLPRHGQVHERHGGQERAADHPGGGGDASRNNRAMTGHWAE